MHDEGGLRRAAERAARIGCDGKWAIHPDQLATINEAFTPSDEQALRAEAIIEAYRAAQESGLGSVTLDGQMLDEAIRRWAVKTLARRR